MIAFIIYNLICVTMNARLCYVIIQFALKNSTQENLNF